MRKAESIISDLRKSGEDSVDKLMETLYYLKLQVEEKEKHAEHMREVIKHKEDIIQGKENLKSSLKQKIEINNADRENEIQALREQLRAQHDLMERQQRHMNELQVNCEHVEEELILANRCLDKKKAQKKQINLQYQELD